MTEQQLFALLLRVSPWAGLVISLLYIVANRIGPVFIRDWQEQRKLNRDQSKTEHEAIVNVYERLLQREDEQQKGMIALQKDTVGVIASATEAINAITKSLDQNSMQVFRLGEAVSRGGQCPLPDCPFINRSEGKP